MFSNIFGRFLWFSPIVNFVVSWCLMPWTLLIYDLVLFCLLFRSCWLLKRFEMVFSIQSLLVSGTYVVTVFRSRTSFFQLNCYLTFLTWAVICFFEYFLTVFHHLVRLWILCLLMFSAMHPSDLWSDLVTDCFVRCLKLAYCLKMYFFSIQSLLKLVHTWSVFRSYASFSELHRCLIF